MTAKRLGLVIVAAGSGLRMNGADKIWDELGDRPVLTYSFRELSPFAASTVVVVRGDDVDRAQKLLGPSVTVVGGGAERQGSVKNGLEALHNVDIIAVHDAARPLAPARLLREGVALLDEFDGAVPAIPIADSVKQIDQRGRILGTVNRDELRMVQTPQVFRAGPLRDAHSRGLHSTDDAGPLEDAGYRLTVFPGDNMAFKLTTPFDMRLARLMIGGSVCP